jgi:hypothetical protein
MPSQKGFIMKITNWLWLFLNIVLLLFSKISSYKTLPELAGALLPSLIPLFTLIYLYKPESTLRRRVAIFLNFSFILIFICVSFISLPILFKLSLSDNHNFRLYLPMIILFFLQLLVAAINVRHAWKAGVGKGVCPVT